MPKTPRTAPEWLAPAATFVAATTAFSWPLPLRLGREIAGPPGDNMIFYWNLWWFREALWKQHHSPFHTPLLFHPDGADLAYHTTTLLGTLPGSLLALVVPLPVAFNLVFAGCFLLAALATYGLARHILHRAGAGSHHVRWLASFAALAWTFAPFHRAHIGHLNIVNVGVVPLAAWMLLRLWEHPAPRRALALGAALGCCTLADGYHVLAALLLMPVLGLLLWRTRGDTPAPDAPGRHTRATRIITLASITFATFIVVSLPVLGPMWGYGSRGLEDVQAGGSNEFVADLASYVLPSPFHPLWGPHLQAAYGHLTGNQAENVVFPTFTILGLALLGWRRGGREARLWGWLAAVFALLSLGPFLHVAGKSAVEIGNERFWRLPLPKLVLDALPLAAGARAAGRFAALGQLGLVSSAMLGLAWWVRPAAARRFGGHGALFGASALVLFECFAGQLPTTRLDIPPAYAVLAEAARRSGARGAVLEIPPVHTNDKRYQLFQTVHGLPLLGGRLARGPRHAYDRLHRDPFLDRTLSSEPWRANDALLALDGLDSLGVTYVVLHAGHTAAGAIARVLERRFEPVPLAGEARLFRRRAVDRDVPTAP